MAGLINLPGYAVPNALNFSGLNAGIDSINQQRQQQTQNALMQEQMGMKREQLGMQRESHGVDLAAKRRSQEVAEARQVAGTVQSIMAMPEQQRMAAWQHQLTQPGFRDLPENMRDLNTAAPMLMAKAAEYMGPEEKAKLGLVQAQTAKALREASEAGGAYGKDIKVFQGPDGKIYGVQAGSRGELKYHDLSAPGGGGGGAMPASPGGMAPNALAPQGAPARQPLTPFAKRSVVGDRVFNPATGSFEGSAAEAIEGGEVAKGRGDAFAKLETSLPKSRATLEAANAKVGLVLSKVDQALPLVSNWSVGPGSYLASLPATQARDLREITNTIVANLGFDELQEMRSNSPTGGALGAIAVQELEMLQKTKTSLDQAQTVGQYTQALNELKSFYSGATARRQRAFEETYAPLNRRTGNSPLVTGPSVPRQFGDRLPQGGPPQPGAQGMIPPQAVQLLRSNPAPEIIQQFEAKYGPGSARQFMGGQ
jgi:hypothetical protein